MSLIKERNIEAADTTFSADLSAYMRTGLWEQCPWVQQVSFTQKGEYIVEFADEDAILHAAMIIKTVVTEGPHSGMGINIQLPVRTVDTGVLREAQREYVQELFDRSPKSTRVIDNLLTAPSRLPNDAHMHVMGHMTNDDHLEIYMQSEMSPIDRRTVSVLGRQLTHMRKIFPSIHAHVQCTFSL